MTADQLVQTAANAASQIRGPVLAGVGSLVTLLIGGAWVQYSARRRWENRDFLDRLHVSLNVFVSGELKIRTILERALADVIPNAHARRKIEVAARRATPSAPILRLPDQDLQFVLNCVLNVAAEHLGGAGLIRLACGELVTARLYALFITSEPVAERRQRKIRAIVIARDTLTDFPYPVDAPTFEHPWHVDRLQTLRHAAELYRSNPELFAHLEVCT